jgi:peptidyl-tRNA hydrolase
MKAPKRLITVTRQDLSPGYQIAQTAHAVANFCLAYRYEALQWHVQGNYVISLAVPDEQALIELCAQLEWIDTQYTVFYESDIREHTAITFIANTVTNELTKDIALAGRVNGTKEKDLN